MNMEAKLLQFSGAEHADGGDVETPAVTMKKSGRGRRYVRMAAILGRVDGFDQDEAGGKRNEGSEVSLGLLAA